MARPRIGIAASVGGVLIISVWLLWANSADRFARTFGRSGEAADLGQWGDSFGGFNALFGALGFLAILATLIVQAHAIAVQRREIHLDRFESAFFSLLTLLRSVRDGLRYSYSDEVLTHSNAAERNRWKIEKSADPGSGDSILTGKAAVVAAVRELRFWIDRDREGGAGPEQVLQRYETFIRSRYESDFGSYFRLIETILARIEADERLERPEKILYAELLRSQLESHEAFLLGLEGAEPGSERLKKLIESFSMLDNLPAQSVRRATLQLLYQRQRTKAADTDQGKAAATPSGDPAPKDNVASASAQSPGGNADAGGRNENPNQSG